jgi:hypothetical protein
MPTDLSIIATHKAELIAERQFEIAVVFLIPIICMLLSIYIILRSPSVEAAMIALGQG